MAAWYWCAPAAPARAEGENWLIEPYLALQGGYDSNYAYHTINPLGSALAGGTAGLGASWLPSIRTRIGTRHTYTSSLNFPHGGRPDGSHYYLGTLDALYLTSLNTSVSLLGGLLDYQAPAVFQRRRTYGSWGQARFLWQPSPRFWTAFQTQWFRTCDDVLRPVITRARIDHDVLARWSAGANGPAFLRWLVHGEGMRRLSNVDGFRFRSLAGGAEITLRLWNGAETGISASRRLRTYDASQRYATRRVDRLDEGGALLRQQFGEDQWLVAQGQRSVNHSRIYPYQRNWASLTWEYAPSWLF